GLADWGQGPERIAKLRASADFTIYTPGSSAGLPVSILKSFASPAQAVREDEEALRERAATTTTGLLALLGIEADPVKSREHILVATILGEAWSRGEDVDLPGLLSRIQAPPFSKIGVIDLEAFFPSKERFALAMKLNNLLAAPGFSAWLGGEPLEVGSLLRTAQGKPRVSIFSIAHLSDAERMFFVTLLLNEVVGWMRGQPGTTSLRALLYMDEIAGYFPPVATPPAKAPLLTLLKQARAFGVGIVLATQNPVDLDYKGLSNCGTWFLGRLQTERDKARVLEGLEGAAAGAKEFDRFTMEKTLAGLGSRVFLMNNVHEDAPEVFETRWSLCYLRGPLTRAQIKTLMDPARKARDAGRADQTPPAAPAVAVAAAARPVLAPDVAQHFAPVRGSASPGAALLYRPAILGSAEVHFDDRKAGVSSSEEVVLLAPVTGGPEAVRWEEAKEARLSVSDLEKEPAAGAVFEDLPSAAARGKSYEAWGRDLAAFLYRNRTLLVLRSPSSKEISRPLESEADFRARLQQAWRERRDEAAGKLRQKYAARLASLESRLRAAEQRVDREKQETTFAGVQTAISVGAAVLGAFLGRKAISATTIGRATTAARGAGRTAQQAGDVARAKETAGAIRQQIADLEGELQSEIDESVSAADPVTEKLEPITLRPKKTDIAVRLTALVWLPHWKDENGNLTAAWE
ncbi:MAG TPA: ATP-binding protein, partial [Thermoanaerobaculia bacterium]|nr:ATP-binding protein [Thermoanaerobaculia bacterium]